jgi:hypothetical protein
VGVFKHVPEHETAQDPALQGAEVERDGPPHADNSPIAPATADTYYFRREWRAKCHHLYTSYNNALLHSERLPVLLDLQNGRGIRASPGISVGMTAGIGWVTSRDSGSQVAPEIDHARSRAKSIRDTASLHQSRATLENAAGTKALRRPNQREIDSDA